MKQELADLREDYTVASPATLVAQIDADDEKGWQAVHTRRTLRRDLALAEAALAFMAARDVDGDATDGAPISPSGTAYARQARTLADSPRRARISHTRDHL